MAADRVHILVAAGLMAGLSTGLAGCGQKGPLYLPDGGGDVVTRPAGQTQPQSQPQSQPQPQPRPDDSDDEKKDPQPR